MAKPYVFDVVDDKKSRLAEMMFQSFHEQFEVAACLPYDSEPRKTEHSTVASMK